MLESSIERRCCRVAKARGIVALKLWPIVTGLPDRLLVGPGGFVWFVEFKTVGGRMTKRQTWWRKRFLAWGFPHDIIRSTDQFKRRLGELL